MDSDLQTLITQALRRAAVKGTLLPYARFHALFSPTLAIAHRYAMLEAVVCTLSDAREVDYGVLLACDNGLPGAEYFLRYRKFRLEAYVATMGDPRYKATTVKGKWRLVSADRQRVYQHAIQFKQHRVERACA